MDWPGVVLLALAALSAGLAAGAWLGRRQCLAGLAALAKHGVPVSLRGRGDYYVIPAAEYRGLREALRRQELLHGRLPER